MYKMKHCNVLFIFRLETKQDQQKYGEIISDFSYFKMSDEFDRKIDNNPVSIRFHHWV
jgi:WASH complex subunit strumpellin